MNIGHFAGRVGKDAELRHTSSGKSVAGFSLAVDVWNGKEKGTQWVDCSVWGDRAEKLWSYIVKGTPLVVYGDISVRTYDGKAGTKAVLCCNVKELTLLGKVGERAAAPAAPEGPRDPDDDIPF